MPGSRSPSTRVPIATNSPAAAPRRKPGAGAPSRERRLGARDWLAAGQHLLREQGISAIKLAALTRRLGVSTGSFYHHFTDFEHYLGELAQSYSLDLVMQDLELALRDCASSPIARLENLARQSLKAGTFELDRAMRVWATMDPHAEAALRRAEATVLDFITEAFDDLGFEAAEASLRARMLLSMNVSPLLPEGRGSHAEFFKGCLRLLVGDAPTPPGHTAT